MDYGSLIGQAWRMTWRYRFLWVLGLFAPSSVGSCGYGGGGPQYRFDSSDFRRLPPDLQGVVYDLANWFSANANTVIFFAIVAMILGVLLALVFMVISTIAQGGMSVATSDLALGRPSTLRVAFSAGLHLFWRFFGLLLIMIGLFIVVALLVGAGVVLAVLAARSVGGTAQMVLVVALGLLAFALFLVAIPFFIAVSIAVAFAQRAIAVEDVGPIEALRVAFRLIRQRAGTSILVWLVDVALSIGGGLLVLFGIVVLLVPLGVLGVLVFTIVGLSAGFVAYVVAAVLLLIVGAWVLGAIANVFFWNYWTLVYLNFTGRLNERLEPVPA
ncbi:MAG TPA: hypothetical protein VHS28_07335 [Chloroflexota bacterium]|nr:hypothetical protein [Chloroflexota bacterium]